jgi:hypothetical protein
MNPKPLCENHRTVPVTRDVTSVVVASAVVLAANGAPCVRRVRIDAAASMPPARHGRV